MTDTRANADQLVPHVAKFVGSSGGGQWRFQLLCKSCAKLGHISADDRTIGDAKALRSAAEKFSAQGWSVVEQSPICPQCQR